MHHVDLTLWAVIKQPKYLKKISMMKNSIRNASDADFGELQVESLIYSATMLV
jgi:hypothetical protein